MKDDKEQTLLLLQIAKTNGNVMALVRNGMELSKLSRLISTLSMQGVLSVGNDYVKLTSKGENYLKSLARSLGKKAYMPISALKTIIAIVSNCHQRISIFLQKE